VPVLDDAQRRVVDHPGGPLLVLAGPGTGKTTTLVEAVVARVERGLPPEQVLVLTFSRKAAAELRERVTARLGRTTRGALAMTFHSYAYALLRRELSAAGGPPLRLLSGPEQDLEVARLLEGERLDGAGRWPEALRPALPLRGFRQELRDLLQRAQERGVDGTDLARLGEAAGRPEWTAAGGFLDAYEGRFALDPSAEVLDHSGLVRAAAALLEDDDELRRREREARRVVLVDEYQDTDPAQVRLLQAPRRRRPRPAGGRRPDQSIYAFRAPTCAACWSSPTRSAQLPASAPRWSSCAPAGARDRRCWPPAGPSRRGCRPAGSARGSATCSPIRRSCGRRTRRGAARAVPDGRGRRRRRRPAPGPPARGPGVVADGGAPAVDAAVAGGAAARAARGRRARSGVPADEVPAGRGAGGARAARPAAGGARPGSLRRRRRAALLGGPLVRADALAVRRLRRGLRELDRSPGGSTPSDALLVEALRDPRRCWRCPSGPRRRSTSRTGSRGAVQRRREAAARRGRALGAWEASRLGAGWSPRAWPAGRAGPRPTARSTPRSRCSTPSAATSTGCRPPACSASSTTSTARRCRATPCPAHARGRRRPRHDRARQQGARVAAGRGSPAVQEGAWPDLRLRGSLLGADDLAALGPAAGR
jgi:hypothetical protein